jgi:hypothetical protein
MSQTTVARGVWQRPSVVVLSIAVLMLAGPGRSVPAAAAPGPSDVSLSGVTPEIVTAGDDEGWVLGRSDRTSSVGLQVWRLEPDGTAKTTAVIPELVSPDAIGFAGGLAVAGLRCVDGGVVGCRSSRAEVILIDDQGDVTDKVTLWEHGIIGEGDGLRIAGHTARSLFVSGGLALYEVTADGVVARKVPQPGGGACVLAGGVYALINAAATGARSDSANQGAPRTVDVGPGTGTARLEVEVKRLDRGWSTLPGSRRVFEAPGYPPTARCTATGFEIEAGVDGLLGRWTPTAGWVRARAGSAPAGAVSAVAASSLSGVHVQVAGGAVVQRGPAGEYERTPLTLPEVGSPGAPPPSLAVDASDRVIVGCVWSVPAVDLTEPVAARGVMSAPRSACAATAMSATTPSTSGAVESVAPRRADSGVEAVTAKLHHYNVCGSSCSDAQASTSINIAQFLFVADGGWSLSLNEVCGTDFLDLARRLNANGTFEVTKRIADGCPDPQDRAFGNAIIHRGAKQDGVAAYLFNRDKICGAGQPDDVECRAMLCLKVAYVGTITGPCTAHLSSASSASLADRQRQAREYIFIATAFNEPARRKSLAGDFNLEPPEIPPVYRDGLSDKVLGNTWNAHDSEQTKHLDYIWLERRDVLVGYQPYCDAGDTASDHCWTRAAWIF